jgi:hypothetical protein
MRWPMMLNETVALQSQYEWQICKRAEVRRAANVVLRNVPDNPPGSTSGKGKEPRQGYKDDLSSYLVHVRVWRCTY